MSADISEAMRRTFPAAQYALLFEVGNRTGAGTSRHIDAITMSLWPSRGLDISGYEFKSHRSDWLHELKNPQKAESQFHYFDHWWLVARPGVAFPTEIPPTWGLMELDGKKLAIRKAAPCNEPQEIGRPFLAAILRQMMLQNPSERQIQEAVSVRVAEIEAEAEAKAVKQLGWKARTAENALAALRDQVQDFEHASGLRISNGWENGRKVGAAVKAVLDFRTMHVALPAVALTRQVAGIRMLADGLEGIAKALAEIEGTPE